MSTAPRWKKRKRRRASRCSPELTTSQVLGWADAHHARTGGWPSVKTGPIPEGNGETWQSVDQCLRDGHRGFPGRSSLARLLDEHRGVRNRLDLPAITVQQILAWADSHHRRTGAWPTRTSGPIPDAPGETWMAVHAALRQGGRGLPGGTTLGHVLAQHRGVRHPGTLPPLTEGQILAWADAHHGRLGRWPTAKCGHIPGTSDETWSTVNEALIHGRRGLPGGSSLPQLLEEHRGRRNHLHRPPLTEPQILAWAEEHHRRFGRWPTPGDGSVVGAEGETWAAVDSALTKGHRGLAGKSSLARLLGRHGGHRIRGKPPPLTEEQILEWADAFRERTGQWPIHTSGRIPEVPGETWSAVGCALQEGLRGLPGGSSLARLLAARRGVPNRLALPELSTAQILEWAAAHRARTGKRPTVWSGPVAESPAETWQGINAALNRGCRGLPGGTTLARLLDEHQGPVRRTPGLATE